jgi:hypothetical protein
VHPRNWCCFHSALSLLEFLLQTRHVMLSMQLFAVNNYEY